jgi:hypothetical protein
VDWHLGVRSGVERRLLGRVLPHGPVVDADRQNPPIKLQDGSFHFKLGEKFKPKAMSVIPYRHAL